MNRTSFCKPNSPRATLASASVAGLLLVLPIGALLLAALAKPAPSWELTDLKPEVGLAFLARLPVQPVDGERLELYEDARRLGPGECLHDEIRQKGGGRFSVWNGYIYLSSSDGADPRTSGRTYRLQRSTHLDTDRKSASSALPVAFLLMTIVGGWFIWRGWRLPAWGARLITAAVSASLALLFSLWLVEQLTPRAAVPNRWECDFFPGVGVHLKASTPVVWSGPPTNPWEFTANDVTNEHGFLDESWPAQRQPGEFRVVILGDSFAEGAQVERTQRFGRVLEHRLNSPGRSVRVITLANAGLGTANQLAYWRFLGKTLQPDLVLVLFVANDWRNNSPELECRQQGWDIQHPPRFFMDLDATGRVIEYAADPNWGQFIDPAQRSRYHDRLQPRPWWRRFWNASTYDPARTQEEILDQFDGQDWNGCPVDDLFYLAEDRLPEVAKKAICLTELAFRKLRDEVTQAGAEFRVVRATTRFELKGTKIGGAWPRDPENHTRRLAELFDSLQIPWLDLAPMFRKQPRPLEAHWRVDGHWSATGHRWAAEATADWLSHRKVATRPAKVAKSSSDQPTNLVRGLADCMW